MIQKLFCNNDNFSIHLEKSPTNGWGNPDKNGSFSHNLGIIQRGVRKNFMLLNFSS